MNEGQIARFAGELEGWCFDEVRALGAEGNAARFRNEFRDMYDWPVQNSGSWFPISLPIL